MAAPPVVHEVLRSSGQPLDPATRAFMEPRFGHDFARVRVHADAAAGQSARDVNAHAYTVGQNIVFGAGQFAPSTHEGRQLIAHELAHVVQQSPGAGPALSSHDGRQDLQSIGGGSPGSRAPICLPAVPAPAGLVQRNANEDLAAYGARELNEYVQQNARPYKHVIEAIKGWERKELDDDVAADFVEMQTLEQLEKFASSGDGMAMLGVLDHAMTTGTVTKFETLQSERLAYARWQYDSSVGISSALYFSDPAVDDMVEKSLDIIASQIAQELSALAAKGDYAAVTRTVISQRSGTEDNVASHFLVLQSPAMLERFASSKAGRAMLDAFYEAIITGDVTDFERMQADRLLLAKTKKNRAPSEAEVRNSIENPAIFPLATAWSSTATIRAKLTENGKVEVFYDAYSGVNQPPFQAELKTLLRRYGESAVKNGIILDPDEVVMVKLYDQNEVLLPVPALQLIDYFNQQKQDTLGKIKTVAIMGATVGVGGIGAGGILEWADTAVLAINAGSLVVNAYRKDIAQTAAGREFLSVWDVAVNLAEYYNWGRLGVDGLRLIHAKVSPALQRWSQEIRGGASATEQVALSEAQGAAEKWLGGVKDAESAEARKYLEKHPPEKVEGAPGERHAELEGGKHEVREVAGGGCKLYSDSPIDVECPAWEAIEKKANAAERDAMAAREAEKDVLRKAKRQEHNDNIGKMKELEEKINRAKETMRKSRDQEQIRRNEDSVRKWKGEQEQLRWQNNALRKEEATLSIPERAGGSYKEISRKTRDNFSEANHMPAWDSYNKSLHLSYDDGPSLYMLEEDHKRLASSHSSPGAIRYRAEQRALIEQGEFMKAFEKDVQDIKDKGLYERYQHGIEQARAYAKKVSADLKYKTPHPPTGR